MVNMVNSLPTMKTTTVSTAPVHRAQDSILAAIDMGTNSIHMVVVRVDTSLSAFTIIARQKDTVRLGDRDPKTGNLTAAAMERSLAALQRCKDLAESFQAQQILAVATSATREAPNGKEFLDTIYRQLGLIVNLISGQEEARRIYLGVLSSMDFHHQPHSIIDIGGGSTELILGDSYETRFLSSTKIGAVRLTQKFISTDPISNKEFNYLRAYVKGMLERPVEELQANLRPGEQFRLVGTSGTIETLASIHALDTLNEEPNPLNGYTISYKDLKEMVKHFAAMNYSQRYGVPGMSDRRAEIILAGAVILQEAMSMLDCKEIIICLRSLREGMIVDWMLNRGLISSHMRYQSEVRQRSVMKIAAKYRVDLEHGKRVADFATSIFDQTQGYLHDWGTEERQLLEVAAILHNCGIYISHAAHHKHSYYLIRNAELLGFTELELEVISNIARYHRKSKPKKKHQAYSNLPAKHQKMVQQLSGILRLAVALDRRQIGAISEVRCDCNLDNKVLQLQLVPQKADDTCALELWSLDYKKEIFEEEYGVKVVANLIV